MGTEKTKRTVTLTRNLPESTLFFVATQNTKNSVTEVFYALHRPTRPSWVFWAVSAPSGQHGAQKSGPRDQPIVEQSQQPTIARAPTALPVDARYEGSCRNGRLGQEQITKIRSRQKLI